MNLPALPLISTLADAYAPMMLGISSNIVAELHASQLDMMLRFSHMGVIQAGWRNHHANAQVC